MATQPNPRRPYWIAARALPTLTATTITLLLAFAGQALAVTGFPLIGHLGGPSPSSSFGSLASESVAVNATNEHVMVADSGSGLVYDFPNPSSTSPTIWNGSTTPAGSFGESHVSVAVDNTTGDVYIADTKHLVIDKLNATGEIIKTFGDSKPTANGQLAGTETPAGSFSHPDETPVGIAVNQATHDLYVIDSGHKVIDVFDSEGHYLPAKQITETPLGLYESEGELTDGIAVNATTGHVFIADSISVHTYEFDAAGLFIKTWDGSEANNPPGTPSGSFGGGFTTVAVNNTTGSVYITETFPGKAVDEFNTAGEYLAQIPGIPGIGIAVDQTNGQLYVSDNTTTPGPLVRIFGGNPVLLPTVTTGAASAIHATAATLNGIVNPEGVAITDCHFAYVEAAAYEPQAFDPYAAGGTIPCAETLSTTETTVHADVTGLHVGTVYHYRLLASNANGPSPGEDQTLSTLSPPTITNASASGLTATTVDLHAQIDPHSVNTAYHFEYGTTTSYTTTIPTPDEAIGSQPTEVTQHITGLAPNTTYHWRITATSEGGTTTSPDHTFNYLTTGAGTLPDNRAYEMVTPPNKNGALIGDVALGLFPNLARNGERLILSAIQCFTNAESCIVNRGKAGASFQFQRTPAGWQATSLAPSTNLFETNSVWSNSADTATALYSMPTPPTGQDDLYLRQPNGQFTDIGPTTPPEAGPQGAIGAQSSDAKAATADFSHYVYGLVEPVWPFDATSSGTPDTVYEYVGTGNTQPLLVGVSGPRASHDLVSVCGTNLGTSRAVTTYPGSLSEDGGTVFFTATGKANGECVGSGTNASTKVLANTLYARLNESETTLISGRSTVNCDGACQASPPGDAEFQGASTDGKRVFFTSTQQLTSNASEDETDTAFSSGCAAASGVNGCNLYEYDFSRPASDRVVAVSAGAVSGGPRVQGVMAVSDDGSHVYFVAKGVLSSAANSQGQGAQAGANNLYVYAAGHVTFVATLAGSEEGEWSEGPVVANVSPDGRFLVFSSAGRLTGDTGVAGVLQVFRYDATTGELLRLSRGVGGFNDDGNSPLSTFCSELRLCADAASVVRADAFVSFAGSWRRDPSMSGDGSFVFFQSPVGLVPGALNDVRIGEENGLPLFAENVYEWHAGRVSLVSDGRDVSIAPTALCGLRSAVCLAGASVSGRDVFFTSSDKLVPTDTDTQLDFYDARVCSPETGDPCVAGPVGSVAACGGEACHGIPAGTPPSPSAPSASFNGAGNPALPARPVVVKVKCRKHFVRRHGRCVKVKHKARGHARGRHARAGGRGVGRAGR